MTADAGARLAAAVSCTDPVPSPDGALLAWVGDRTGRPRAHLAALRPGPVPTWAGAPVLRTGDGDVQALHWAPDGRGLACQVAPGGGERTRVRLVTPAGDRCRDLAPDAAAATLGSWSPDGHRVGISVFAEGRGDGLACLVDVRDGSSTVLAGGPAPRVCAVAGDGRRAVVRLGRRGDRRLELVDLRTGARTPLLPGGGATVADARFGISGDHLYLHTDAGRDRVGLHAVGVAADGAAGVARPVAERDGADLDIAALDPAGARAALVWNVAGTSELELLDLRSGHRAPLPAPGAVVTGLAFTRDGRGLLVAAESATAPPAITRLDLTRPRPAPVPRWPGLVAPALRTYRAEDELPLAGWLYRPPDARGPAPTLLWLHGGPEAQERPGWQPLFQALVAAGVAVFAPNVRGSAGYGRSFAGADDGARRHVAITDVRATVAHLVGAGLADPHRVGVAGRSYGGYLALVALAWFPELFAVGVDVCGMSDLATFFAGTEPWIAAAATSKYGDPGTDAALLHELSPIHRAARIRAPLLVVHGAHDTNVPLGEAEAIVAALRDRPPRLLLLDDEGHEFRGHAARTRFVREVTGFVASHLHAARG